MKNKLLWVINIIVAAGFIIFFAILAIADKVKWTGFFIGVTIIILLLVLVDGVIWLMKREKKLKVGENGEQKIITLDEARKIVREMIINIQYAEEEGELIYEDIWTAGRSNTPIYARLLKGLFDGNFLGVLIDMSNPKRRSIKQYSPTKLQNDIKADMQTRANLLAKEPYLTPSTEEEVIEDPSGRRTYRKAVLTKQDRIKENEKGDLV